MHWATLPSQILNDIALFANNIIISFDAKHADRVSQSMFSIDSTMFRWLLASRAGRSLLLAFASCLVGTTAEVLYVH